MKAWFERLPVRNRVLGGLAALLVAVAAVLFTVGRLSQHHAPMPSASEAVPTTPPPVTARSTRATTSGSSSADSTKPSAPVASSTRRTASASAPTQSPADPADTSKRSRNQQHPNFQGPSHLDGAGARPIELSIPAIDVDSRLLTLGLNKDQSIETPPLSDVRTAGWYKYSPVPGKLGPSVILGHIDSATAGEGVFFRLGAMHRGDNIFVRRADAKIATFTVDRIVEFPKASFPTQTVYGNTDNSQIRLITCGGNFDTHTHHYLDNIVVFGSLSSLGR